MAAVESESDRTLFLVTICRNGKVAEGLVTREELMNMGIEADLRCEGEAREAQDQQDDPEPARG